MALFLSGVLENLLLSVYGLKLRMLFYNPNGLGADVSSGSHYPVVMIDFQF